MAALEQARALFGELQPRVTPPHADALVGLGRANIETGRPDRALPLLEEADRFWRDFDPETRWAGEAALWLGRAYAQVGRAAEAKATLSRAKTILSRSPIQTDASLVRLASKTQF
jgi:tetratricopeptide (TPR) repeat protein